MNSKLSCPKCKERFQDPRILPCGETICNLCIIQLMKEHTESEKNGFNCTWCDNYHQQPEDGFVSCKFLNSLMSEKPTDIYKSKNIEKLKNNLNFIHEKIQKMSSDLKHGSDRIKDYCLKLRHDIKSRKELLMQELNKECEEYLSRVDSYEKDCIDQFSLKDKESNKLSFYNFIYETNLFYKSWIFYLNKNVIDENEIHKIIGYTESKLFKIKKEEVGIKHFLFNKDILIYKHEELNIHNLIGDLYHEKIHGINLKKLEKINLKRSFDEDNPKFKQVRIECMDDGNFAFGVLDSNWNFKLKVFTNNGALVKTFTETHEHKFDDFSMRATRNKIVVYKNSLEASKCFLEVVSDCSDKKKSVQVSFVSPLISANDSNIYVLEREKENMVHVYDYDLNLILDHCQNIASIHNNISQFEIEYDKVYVLDKENLKILNKKTGEMVFRISLKSEDSKFSISHQEIVIMNENLNKITYYSKVNGLVLYEDELVNCPINKLNMVCERTTNKIIFFDKLEFLLYV